MNNEDTFNDDNLQEERKQKLEGQSRQKCTSVPPRSRFGTTIGSNPKVPLNNLLNWSDNEDTNS